MLRAPAQVQWVRLLAICRPDAMPGIHRSACKTTPRRREGRQSQAGLPQNFGFSMLITAFCDRSPISVVVLQNYCHATAALWELQAGILRSF